MTLKCPFFDSAMLNLPVWESPKLDFAKLDFESSFRSDTVRSSATRLHDLGSIEHRVHDLVVTRAAAQIARQRVAHLGLARIRIAIEERLGRDQKSWRADSALEARIFEELLLQRMQRRAVRQALDGGDLLALSLNPEHQAGTD